MKPVLIIENDTNNRKDEEEDLLIFHYRSRHMECGKAKYETVSNPEDYKELNKIENWRHVLSSLWIGKFKYDDYTFNTLSHAMQYCKFKCTNHIEKAKKFTIESNTLTARGSGLLAHRQRKSLKLNEDELRIWKQNKKQLNYDITYAKFSQIEKAKNILKLTGNARLVNKGPRIATIYCTTIEKVRSDLFK